jgi:O-antigen ligase
MTNWHTTVLDIISGSPLRWLVYNRRRWLLVGLLLLLLVISTIATGWLIGEFDALPVLALFIALIVAVLFIYKIEFAYISTLAIIAMLPFGSLPFSIGFTPTFLDLALVGLYFVWLMPYVLGEEKRFIATPVGSGVLIFALFAIAAFVAGLSHGTVTTYLIRHFTEVLLSITSFFLIVNTVKDVKRLRCLLRWLILATTAAAILGIVLYLLPEVLTIRLLSALARFGYPSGTGVLRYVRDDPELMKRATSTSVDPNVLGSLLNITIVLTVPQIFAKRPVLPRMVVLVVLGVMGLCLGLTISRGAMLGCAIAITVISLLRYQKILPWLLLGLVLVVMLPWTQELILHFIEGFRLQDLSTQMRLGEYKDALILISRYPLLGVGFTGAPDIDIYVAVANVYLIVAAQMGLIGLCAFLYVIGSVLVRFMKYRFDVTRDSDLEPLWYGLHAAIIGGILSGLFDHYFFSLDFHHSVTLFWFMIGMTTAATEMVISEKNPLHNR